ncbi:ATP-binding protein [Actinomadura viridis]|uniref:ATP-binding protein n=1 Tax=Actinomadura viridis TaxID=58110 RepID=UPI0036776059
MNLLGHRLELSTPETAPDTRKTVRALAASIVTNPGRLDDIELMTGEGLANALLHGEGPIDVSVSVNADRVCVEIKNHARSNRPANRHRLDQDHGRGLSIIDALATSWRLERTDDETALRFEVDVD